MPKQTPQWRRCPKGWKRLPGYPEQWTFQSRDGLAVITSDPLPFGDGKLWGHVSCSRADRIPSYEDVATVKRLFVGRRRKAIQVFPSEDEHVNFHPHCLHLWWTPEDDGLPDFTMGMGFI